MLYLQNKTIIPALLLVLTAMIILCAGCMPDDGADITRELPPPVAEDEQLAEADDNYGTGYDDKRDIVAGYSQKLTDALAWEQVRFGIYEYQLFEKIGDTVYELSYGSWTARYFWIPDLGEGVYVDELDEFYLFSDQILSNSSRCVATAVKIKRIIESWDGETSFSKEKVLTSERDIKWVEGKPPESSYLEYNFGRYKARIFTNELPV
jgi:hypothetical protein